MYCTLLVGVLRHYSFPTYQEIHYDSVSDSSLSLFCTIILLDSCSQKLEETYWCQPKERWFTIIQSLVYLYQSRINS